MRSADCLPPELAGSLLALWTGVLYDQEALDRATELTESWTSANLEESRPELVRRGLAANLGGRRAVDWAERLLEIARSGLQRRAFVDAEGRTEAVLLEPIERLLAEGQSPADRALARYAQRKAQAPAEPSRRALIESVRLRARGE